MTAALWLENLWAYSLQLAALVTAGAVAAAAFKLRDPSWRLRLWQLLLGLALILPLVQPWRHPAGYFSGGGAAAFSVGTPIPAAGVSGWAFPEAAWGGLAAGFCVRALWLLAGFLRLGRYRAKARVLDPLPAEFDVCRRRIFSRPRPPFGRRFCITN